MMLKNEGKIKDCSLTLSKGKFYHVFCCFPIVHTVIAVLPLSALAILFSAATCAEKHFLAL